MDPIPNLHLVPPPLPPPKPPTLDAALDLHVPQAPPTTAKAALVELLVPSASALSGTLEEDEISPGGAATIPRLHSSTTLRLIEITLVAAVASMLAVLTWAAFIHQPL